MLQSVGFQTAGHESATEQQQCNVGGTKQPSSTFLPFYLVLKEEVVTRENHGTRIKGLAFTSLHTSALCSQFSSDMSISFELVTFVTTQQDSLDWASLVSQTVKNLPAMRETWI